MSGFFRSLAEHAVAPGPRVRPVAPPFAIEPASGRGWDLEQDALAPAPPVFRVTTSAPGEETPAAAGKAPARPAGGERPTGEVSTRLTEVPPRGGVEPQSDHPAGERSEGAAEPSPAPPAVTAGAQPEPIERAPTTIASRPHDRRRSTAARASRVLARPPLRREPPPAPVGGAGRAADARADTPPDVQIHIGRIELTAVAAPPPARRRVPAAGPALGLGDYLRQRDGKAR